MYHICRKEGVARRNDTAGTAGIPVLRRVSLGREGALTQLPTAAPGMACCAGQLLLQVEAVAHGEGGLPSYGVG